MAALAPGSLHRDFWGKDEDARAGGHPVEFLTVAGRTMAWVPARQG